MKILKVYDKINRNTLQVNYSTGDITIREYTGKDYIYLVINTKLFNIKNKNVSYFSYRNIVNNQILEELDVTTKYIYFKQKNEQGLLSYSKRIHIKDTKSILEVRRIYDEKGEFIEIENHNGKKTINFKINKEILTNFLNLI